MKPTYEKGDRLHEVALQLQREKFADSYEACLTEAARQFDSQNEHGQNTFAEDEPEDWQAEFDRRHKDIQRIAESEKVSYAEAAGMYAARQGDARKESTFASKGEPTLHVMGKPATASATGIPPGTLPGVPVLRPIAFKNGKFIYQPFPS